MRRSHGSRRINLNMDDLFSIVERSEHVTLNEKQRKKLKLALRSLAELANLDYRTSEKTSDVLDDADGDVLDDADGDGGDGTTAEGGDGGTTAEGGDGGTTAEGGDGGTTAEGGDGGDPDDGDPDLPARDDEDEDGDGSIGGDGSDSSGASASDQGQADPGEGETKKRPGHGRIGADAYSAADHTHVSHPTLKPGDPCPEDCGGKVYEQVQPSVTVRITGSAPLKAKICKCQRLRCNLCGTVFTAPVPPDFEEEKYDASAAAMIGLLRYGTGVPFHRLESLQGNLGVPLPDSTQWDISKRSAGKLKPVLDELVRQAADGEVLYSDDTGMTVLSLKKREHRASAGSPADRTGMFTTGIVSTTGDRKIALFFTGWKHAGENLGDVLSKRRVGLSLPIQMCDGLDRNLPKEFRTVLGNCLAHGRRGVVKTIDAFPTESRHVLLTLRDVYKNDETCRKGSLSKEERLRFHQEKSGPIMENLEAWLKAQFTEKLVEPNSSFGGAINYLLKRWAPLTLFLRVEGAPLDNNICERALKMSIRHRRNSLFYKTLNGAAVGDIFQSLIHTAEHAGANPLEYLIALMENADDVKAQPERWMPWNYQGSIPALAVA